MRVLVACEFSGVVREAFRHRGHEAWSCDLLDSEAKLPEGQECWPAYSNYNEPHLKGDVKCYMGAMKWDLVVAHPPCTYMANSGVRWLKGNPERRADLNRAVEFFLWLYDGPWPTCIENPIMHKHAKALIEAAGFPSKPTQIIQPWMFGHGETKATCLWLKGLPKLIPTKVVEGRTPRVHHASPGPDRWKERSRTLKGIAEAMAEQWGTL